MSQAGDGPTHGIDVSAIKAMSAAIDVSPFMQQFVNAMTLVPAFQKTNAMMSEFASGAIVNSGAFEHLNAQLSEFARASLVDSSGMQRLQESLNRLAQGSFASSAFTDRWSSTVAAGFLSTNQQILESFTRVLADSDFAAQQRAVVTRFIEATARAADSQRDTSAPSPDPKYGARQLSISQIGMLYLMLWPILQVHLQQRDDRYLLESHIMLLLALSAVWLISAAI